MNILNTFKSRHSQSNVSKLTALHRELECRACTTAKRRSPSQAYSPFETNASLFTTYGIFAGSPSYRRSMTSITA